MRCPADARLRSAVPIPQLWGLRRARQVLGREVGEISTPSFLVVAAELEQTVPAENSGRLHVVEHQPHRIITDWMQFQDFHILLSGNCPPFARRMTLHFGARAAYAQIFGRKIELLAVIKGDRQYLPILAQAQLSRPRTR